jgi:hypothetical protein
LGHMTSQIPTGENSPCPSDGRGCTSQFCGLQRLTSLRSKRRTCHRFCFDSNSLSRNWQYCTSIIAQSFWASRTPVWPIFVPPIETTTWVSSAEARYRDLNATRHQGIVISDSLTCLGADKVFERMKAPFTGCGPMPNNPIGYSNGCWS